MMKKPTYEQLFKRVQDLEKGSLKRKWVEKALLESERRYRDLYENAPNAYFSVSALAGSILRCNSAALRFASVDLENKTSGKPIYAIF
jgi:PAS domain-containing protein